MSPTLSPGEARMLIEVLNSINERLLDHELIRAYQYMQEVIASIPYANTEQ